mmetsp:Transcript_22061/g.62022  ORF Transcript_22061/g.62022 Transcript_22061/m.62022 type:complete len:374 (-) Transcript_22061:420-1541(-)
MAVEGRDPEPFAHADPHHRLPPRLPRQVVTELRHQLDPIPLCHEPRVVVQAARGEPCSSGQAWDVRVLARSHEDVDGNLCLGAFRGKRAPEPIGVCAQRVLAVGAVQRGVLPAGLDLARALGGGSRLEEQHLPPRALCSQVRRLQRWPGARVNDLRLFEGLRDGVQEGVQGLAALPDIDDEVLRGGQEDVFQVRQDHHGRARGPLPHRVVMNRGVESDEAHLRPLAARQVVEGLPDGLDHSAHHAGRDGSVGHVDDEDESRRHGGPDHVLRGGHKFHSALQELRPLVVVLAPPVVVQSAEILHRDLVGLPADVANPPTPAVGERDVGVDVRPAAPAPHHPSTPEVHHRHRLRGVRHGVDDGPEGQGPTLLQLG